MRSGDDGWGSYARSRDVVEVVWVGDPACGEPDGVDGFYGKLAIAEGHRAMLEEHLEEAVALVEAAHFVQDALDGGVVVLKDDWLLVDCDGNQVVGDGVGG